MSYIKFKKEELINLEFSLTRELIRTNRAGSYASTTIIGCNTRRYHGLLVCPLAELDGENHVLLSALDDTVIQHDASFNLAIHKYPNAYDPKGHKYAQEFYADPIPTIIYRVGGVILKKERIFSVEDERILIRYTLLEANSPTKLRFKPFLAFRSVHSLMRENMYANTKYIAENNGISMRLYQSYPSVFMQFSKEPDYVHVPHWYYNIEYIEDQKLGMDYQEDLFVPGYFELEIEKDESIVFAAGLNEVKADSLNYLFDKEIKNRIPRNSYLNCLKNAGQQFIIKKDNNYRIIAGFPWFGTWSRDTFISLTGLTLVQGKYDVCKNILDFAGKQLKNGLFPNYQAGKPETYKVADAPLWYFYAVQQYLKFSGDITSVINDFYPKMLQIFDAYKNGTDYNIKMCDNALIYSGNNRVALTWMDVCRNGAPVTPRNGFAVEINALWYNAVSFLLEVAKLADHKNFEQEYDYLPLQIKNSFEILFWDSRKRYLADYHVDGYSDWKIRPNMIFAASLPYKVVDDYVCKAIVDIVKSNLLTTRGLRSLSPTDKDYIGSFTEIGGKINYSYHQGTVWPWLLGAFADAYLALHGKSGLSFIEKLFNEFEDEMDKHGIGTISEIYEGDPPHLPGGGISQAWNVAELLRINYIINKYKEEAL